MTDKFTLQPFKAVILAIDPGKQGGACIRAGTEIRTAGQVRPGEESRWVESALRIAEETGLSLVVVAETWTFGGKGKDPHATASMRMGLCERWGMWKGALLAAGVSESRVVRVNARSWQGKLLACGFGATSEKLKDAAEKRVGRLYGLELNGDAADAVCLSDYAMRLESVAEIAARKMRRMAVVA